MVRHVQLVRYMVQQRLEVLCILYDLGTPRDPLSSGRTGGCGEGFLSYLSLLAATMTWT